MEIEVVIRAKRRIPWKGPTHPLLELLDLGDGGSRDEHQGGVLLVQVTERRGEIVRKEGTA